MELDGFKKQAGLNSFTLTPKRWIEKTGAIGIVSKAGRNGGTYAHKDIAFEFGEVQRRLAVLIGKMGLALRVRSQVGTKSGTS